MHQERITSVSVFPLLSSLCYLPPHYEQVPALDRSRDQEQYQLLSGVHRSSSMLSWLAQSRLEYSIIGSLVLEA